MDVYALLQAANLRSTIDIEALEPGMAGMAVLLEVGRMWGGRRRGRLLLL